MSFSNILSNNGGDDDLARLFDETEAAADFLPVPLGTYECHIVDGKFVTSRNGKPGYCLTLKIIDGEHIGRRLWHTCWLTPAAMPQTKRELLKFGVTSLGLLNKPLPRYIRCKCRVVIRKDDSGKEWNEVKSFEVIGIDPYEDPFAPTSNPDVAPEIDPFFF